VNRPRRIYLIVIALVTMVQGLRMLTGNEADYPALVYRTAFIVMPFKWWGWFFAVTGVIMLVSRRHGVTAYLVYACGSIVWAVWAGCLWVEIPQRAGVVQPTGYAVLCIVGAYALHESYVNTS
jgi:hypothetical protein